MSLAHSVPPPALEAAASTAARPGRPLPGILYCAGLGAAVYLALGDGQALHWDNSAHNLPLYLEGFRQLRSGVLPASNPFIWSGALLLADPRSQAVYPLTWLACLLAGARPTDAMSIAYAPQVVLAAAGMYLLGRSLDMSTAGALLAATVFAVNPYSVFLGTGFFNEFATVAWLPWIVLCVRRAATSGPFRWVAAGAAAAAAAWCAGYPQLWAYGMVVAGCGFAFSSRSGGRGAIIASVVLLAGLGLVMFQFLPFAVLWRESQRAIPLGIDQFLTWGVPMAAWPACSHPASSDRPLPSFSR